VRAVYETTGDEASFSKLSATSLDSDNAFSDGSSSQVASVTGNASEGYVATLLVTVNV
jgi:hypothetical protein